MRVAKATTIHIGPRLICGKAPAYRSRSWRRPAPGGDAAVPLVILVLGDRRTSPGSWSSSGIWRAVIGLQPVVIIGEE